MTQSESGVWSRLIGVVLHYRLVVYLLTLLVVMGGLYTAPFDWDLGDLPRDPVAVDAIPDIGENQQIVFTAWPGRSPRDVEDQVTYPLTTALLGMPGVRTVRSTSALGFSTIYVLFDDDVDFYWSRSRVLEKLSALPADTLPDGANPTLGPDATALGQVFWYTLEGHDPDGNVVGGWDADELRTIQDWTVRYALQSVDGVSEVASVGGFVREYQIDVDPDAMRAAGVSLTQVADAVRRSNLDVGARTLEINGVEYVVRGLGQVRDTEDIEQIVVAARDGTPVRVRDVARVAMGPSLRRGALDDEGAPAVGGVVVARYLENPLAVITAVKERLAELQPGLPRRTLDDGTVSQVTVVPFYDRSVLIGETLDTLSQALWQQLLITFIVVLVMLRNLRSSALIGVMLPLGVLATFGMMKLTGVSANIMALGGIAIAIGTMVDLGIVLVENIGARVVPGMSASERRAAVRGAAAEVAPAVVTSVLTTVVSFLPVFGLTATELRMFAPLALTKTFAMLAALVLAVVLLPPMSLWMFRDRPAPAPGSGMARVRRSVWRAGHLRDALLIGLGALVMPWSPAIGVLVIALGVWRFVRPLVSERARRRGGIVENAAVVALVGVLLTMAWLPLGPQRGVLLNLMFVVLLVGAVLGTFRLFERAYPSILMALLAHRTAFLAAPAALVLVGTLAWLGSDTVLGFVPQSVRTTAPMQRLHKAFPGMGREFMPPFDEGSFLYMPTTMPHASIGEVIDMMSAMDAAIAQIPEVDRAVGKLGRVDSALDPAPISMIETVVTYVPEFGVDADGNRVRQWRDHITSPADIWQEITRAAQVPGLTGAPVLMPIEARLVMLQSGMRAPMGIKVKGPSLDAISDFGRQLEGVLRTVPGIRSETVFADRVVGKPYLEIDIDRQAIARYGLTVSDVQDVLQLALGGTTLTRTVEGRERYPVRVRYMREDRDSVEALERVFIPTPNGEQIPLTQVASFRYERGPQMIRSEDTFLTSFVLFDKEPELAEVGVVQTARAAIEAALDRGDIALPEGVRYEFAGSYENQVRSERRLKVLVPVAMVFVFILLYLQFSRVRTALIIASGVAVAVSGGMLLLWLYSVPGFLQFSVLGVHVGDLFQVGTVKLSVAVWVGFIALIGLATDDGVVMATYLRQRFLAAPPTTVDEVRQRTLEAGTRRVRPCLMTTATTLLALLPVITSHGRGSDVMVPLALPILGGMGIALLTLFVVPVLWCAAEERGLTDTSTVPGSGSGPVGNPAGGRSGT